MTKRIAWTVLVVAMCVYHLLAHYCDVKRVLGLPLTACATRGLQ
jgi:hypothetical protein